MRELIIESSDAHKDLETLRCSISTEQRSISQLEMDSEGPVSTNDAHAVKIVEMVRDIQETIARKEQILIQVNSSSEDYTAEVSQLQQLLNAINDQIGTYVCLHRTVQAIYKESDTHMPIDRHQHQCLGASTRLEDLQLKRNNLEQKIVIINAETASLEELLLFCVREKNDAEAKAVQTAEGTRYFFCSTVFPYMILL